MKKQKIGGVEQEEKLKTKAEAKVEKWETILKDPQLFEKIAVNELDKKVVGEIGTRKVLVLCAYGGRLVDNCQTASYNLMVNDDAGTGKDYTAGASLELLPKENYIRKTRISPTVLNYWHNAKDEPLWTWDGKVLYLEDISEGILNHDVFKVMCSGGSSATIVIDKKIVELEVVGKPVMIVTTASATPTPELTRRFVILNLDSSIDQTKEIMKRHSQFRKQGIIPMVNPTIKDAMQLLKQVKVKIPFADIIDEHFPSKNIIMRTHYPRFLDFISASTGLHQFQRKKDDEGFFIAEGQDYDIARECFLKLTSNKYMISLTINQKKILKIFEAQPYLEGSVAELHANNMNFISDRALSDNLSLLAQYGILQTFQKTNSQNRDVESYKLAESYKPNEKIYIPTYEELCRITSEPSEPSIPSLTSTASLPNKKEVFLEVPKQAKPEPGDLTGTFLGKEQNEKPNEQELYQNLEDFEQ